MAIRHIAAAALLVCASAAHADTISATSAPSTGFLNNWTTGNGTDVLSSGVLGNGNLNLVGGVSYGSAAKDNSLTDILMGKASASMAEVDGKTQLFFSRGVEGTYLLAAGNGILAATLGDGKSVIGTADGALILDGVNGKPVMSGGGNAQGGSGGSGGGNTGGSGGSSGSSGSNGSTGSSGSNGSTGATGANGANGSNGSNGSAGQNGSDGSETGNPVAGDITNPGGGTGVGGGAGQLPTQDAVDPSEVPEPSSIALMLAGMLGAGALSRRRSR
ncbi:PEP-CTERM sorting domain-containing protein [Massilia sp. G4R7]|uniref:PEP-CTERM sorting domain-containing protein n=1 Tax=Massilia phyllostachyos TaxID=2898585 RepID=A0ABS8Q4L6_9BURK|nr:PEP-CTERM sorting domain-containing protein [Massilia phyllostachyos]MCD2516483.1 PEP-CTERM sorting domain-containing protein [Massilia phyllostachyos]